MTNIPIIAISGYKNTGKTTLMCKLIKHFTDKGIKVGTIKHDGHNFNVNNDTDSNKHFLAGATSLVYDNDKIQLHKRFQDDNIYSLSYLLGDVDIILIEGLKNSSFPKIELRHNASDSCCTDINTIIAIACTNLDSPNAYHRDDIPNIVLEIEKYLERTSEND